MADTNSMNLVILVGRVAGDVKFETGKGKDQNTTIARFSLATNEIFRDNKPVVNYHYMVAFGGRAETCHKWCKKGTLVAIKGKLRNRQWQDEEGNKRYSTQVNIDEITFLGKKEDYEKEAAPRKWKGKDDPL
jgi:single-strand DNA-binding protein